MESTHKGVAPRKICRGYIRKIHINSNTQCECEQNVNNEHGTKAMQ